MRLKACVNGPRKPSEHPALPVTADDLAREVAGVRAAGADAAHVHVKNAEGIDTFAADSLEAVVARCAVGCAGNAARRDHRGLGASRPSGPGGGD